MIPPHIPISPKLLFHYVAFQVLKHIPKSTNVVVLTTQAAVDYKGDVAAGQMLALKTSAFSQKLSCGVIKTPNIIAGLPAQGKGLVTEYWEGELQNGRRGGGHVKFYPYEKGGGKFLPC